MINKMADGQCKMIVSEILCYIQNKMNTTEHDIMIKSVVAFYREDDIHEAKILLFEECTETKLRLKTYKIDKSKNDCIDIINKFNEVGIKCPKFVAENLSNVPLVTADAFDMAKLSNNIDAFLKLENHVSNSFEALSIMQSDFSIVLQKCSKIDVLVDEIAALKLALATKVTADSPVITPTSPILPTSPTTTIHDDDDTGRSEDSSSCDGDVESGAEERANTYASKANQGKSHSQQDTTRKITDGGFTLVDRSRKPNATRVYTNSALKTVKLRDPNKKIDGSLSSVFVSNFTPSTKPDDVSSFLHKKYSQRFKVVQIPSKFTDCTSFKVVVPQNLKVLLLKKESWAPGVYVREFYERSRGLVNLAHQVHSR